MTRSVQLLSCGAVAVSSAILLGMAAGATAAAQAQVANSSCDSFLPAPRQVNGKPVGPASCRMIELRGHHR